MNLINQNILAPQKMQNGTERHPYLWHFNFMSQLNSFHDFQEKHKSEITNAS